ncbi:stalk domain-containing protein [Robertmurraya sp.]|uniref:C40 family peptidase n=1 Tax=Robertmurraya sp. TaxID=2837525 RepID=UPI003704A744
MSKTGLYSLLSLTLAFYLGSVNNAEGAERTSVAVSVNGKTSDFPDARPFVNENGRTIVPVRFLSEQLGYGVVWNETKQSITLNKDKEKLYFRIGQYESEIIDSRTYVPLRYAAEAFGAEVQWNDKEKKAIILTENLIIEPTSPDEVAQEEGPGIPLDTQTGTPAGWQAKVDEVIHLAEKFYGVDYEYGAKAGRTDVFDCSSLTQYVFWKNGITLKRASRPQFLYDGDKVLSRKELRRGDLVFFSTAGTAKKYAKDDYRRNGHVGIVKEVKANGEIMFIHTYQKGIGVTDSIMHANLEKGWWNHHFLYGKRVIADNGSAAEDVTVDKNEIQQYIE